MAIKDRTNNLPQISATDLPSTIEAKNLYVETYNGQLTDEPNFGMDPLENNDELKQQRSNLFQMNFNIAQIFGEVANGQGLKFKQALLYYIHTTNRFR